MMTSLIDTTSFRPHADVVYTHLDDAQAVLFHIVTGCYFELNETGALIWEMVQENRTLAGIIEALEQKYDVSREEAHRQATAFLEKLLLEKLIVLS